MGTRTEQLQSNEKAIHNERVEFRLRLLIQQEKITPRKYVVNDIPKMIYQDNAPLAN